MLESHFLVTVSGVDMVVVLYRAEITTVIEAETRTVDTLKFADVAPAGTTTLAGTVATPVLLLERLITTPPAGAGPLSVTVPVEVDPPLTLAGLSLSAVRVTGCDAAPIDNTALTFELL